ncbi:hypothetical protein E2C01_014883 [Portunus trituberculatus]|uniref:Uncharacterized protein n=1 Tax=Portunus trituberculatus TaxID=210409 RepID=A0A5B7DK85_PORTR|nr:hypothetical protein [Portunus trituberculatus]
MTAELRWKRKEEGGRSVIRPRARITHVPSVKLLPSATHSLTSSSGGGPVTELLQWVRYLPRLKKTPPHTHIQTGFISSLTC